MIDKDVYTFNEMTGQVELTTPGTVNDDRALSPASSPTTPHHPRHKSRSRSSGRKKKLEKAFSTGLTLIVLDSLICVNLWKLYLWTTLDSALNYLGEESLNEESREPSPTKSITPLPEELDQEGIKLEGIVDQAATEDGLSKTNG